MGAAESTEAAPPAQEVTATPKVIQTTQTFPSAMVICGPSGVGKGTLIKQLMASSDKFGFSCSHTTRLPREGEKVLCALALRLSSAPTLPCRESVLSATLPDFQRPH